VIDGIFRHPCVLLLRHACFFLTVHAAPQDIDSATLQTKQYKISEANLVKLKTITVS
jgi:hypothetical protein